MAIHKVGGEVDALCTRCKLLLAHTVVAMVGTKIARVRCNTCGGDHVFRGASAGSAAPRKTSQASQREPKVVIGFAQQIQDKDPSRAKKYSAKDAFAVDDLIVHPTFGMGIVTAVRTDKIDVAFKADTKTLVHRRAGTPSEKPHYRPPQSPSAEPTDKPL